MNRQLKKLIRARAALIMNHPFYGCLALRLKVIEAPEVETMAVDGANLYYAPAFVDALSEPELIGVYVHELKHCAYLHFARRGNRDLKQWNVATDYAINLDVISEGFRLPQGGLLDTAYVNMSAEEIYSILFPPKPKQDAKAQGKDGQGAPGSQDGQGAGTGTGSPSPSQGQGQPGTGSGRQPCHMPQACDPGRCGGILDAAPDQAGKEAAAADWQAAVAQAAAIAERSKPGSVPGAFKRGATSAAFARVSWPDELRRFIDDATRYDYSWARPNRRLLSSGIVMPGKVANGISKLVLVIDVSGSIGQTTLASFQAECKAALDEGNVETVSVIYNDTQVMCTEEFNAGDELKLKPIRGGGTAFSKVMAEIADKHMDAAAIVFFTDLEVSDFGEDSGLPHLWAVWGRSNRFHQLASKVPFGECLHVTPN